MSTFFDLMRNIVLTLNTFVRVDNQNFTEEQKTLARSNIGATAESDFVIVKADVANVKAEMDNFKPEVELTEEQIAALKGKDGVDGKDGYTPVKGVDYFDGKDGINGKDGVDGKTPVKGTDYWTDADKQEIKGYVDSLFVPISQEAYDLQVSNGTVDANKYYMIVGDSE